MDENPPPFHKALQKPKPATPVVVQIIVGFVTWMIAVGLFLGSLQLISNQASAQTALFIIGSALIVLFIGVPLIGLIVMDRWFQEWTGFWPGLALGMITSCLVPVGILFYICGHMNPH